jgi:hypothetical protein
MLFLQGKISECKARITYFCHILVNSDNFSMKPYMFGSFFPALAARIRVKAKKAKTEA